MDIMLVYIIIATHDDEGFLVLQKEWYLSQWGLGASC